MLYGHCLSFPAVKRTKQHRLIMGSWLASFHGTQKLLLLLWAWKEKTKVLHLWQKRRKKKFLARIFRAWWWDVRQAKKLFFFLCIFLFFAGCDCDLDCCVPYVNGVYRCARQKNLVFQWWPNSAQSENVPLFSPIRPVNCPLSATAVAPQQLIPNNWK